MQHRGPDSVVASIPERAVLLTAKSSPRRRRQREDITASGPGPAGVEDGFSMMLQ